MSQLHPRPNEHGKPVTIQHPSTYNAAQTWADAESLATATPDGRMPDQLNGISFAPWATPPSTTAAWEEIAVDTAFSEPAMPQVVGKKPAAGVVTVEPDGRVWVVAPTNSFGGYTHTFPKGKLDGLSPRASAIKETWEESGLKVELTGYLCDSVRSTSVTRYYLARRLGGSPAAMGWESQAVLLVPMGKLGSVITHVNDQPVLAALTQYIQKR